ncbi:CoB--CoM heterodisulfide reductase iron-sulfur subunit B family protein [candidate division KSB1 bacterium]|nr:CoB--CoM heterodisulfide reductase iron-sulfur subunit B family protein [candidate division KSB1 bacterium]
MKLCYYPGCTLKDKTTNLDQTTIAAADELGIELVELPNWTCCGATYPLTEEKIANLVPQIRILYNVMVEGDNRVTTTCAFCYSTLKRANRAILNDPIKRKRINAYLKDDKRIPEYDKETVYNFKDYNGEVKVVHFLEVLRDDVGFENLSLKLKKNLEGLKVAPYYGCKLLRPPEEMEFDDPENPRIMEDFLESLGCEVIDYPFKTDCCGSYLSLSAPDAATRASHLILNSAVKNGADLVALTCPLCYYNLDRRQEDIGNRFMDFSPIPVLFFTQLLAIALGVEDEILGLDQHYIDPSPLLREKKLVT